VAVGGGLELEAAGPRRPVAAGGDEERRAGDEEVVVAGDPAADLPPDPAVDLDLEDEVARLAVLRDGAGQVGREGHVGAGQHGGPDVDVAVALVHGGERRGHRDLLVLVRRVDVEAVVVDPDAVVGVAGRDGHLQGGGEQARGVGEVQLPEGRVLQEEARVRGAQHQVHDQRDDGHDEGQAQQEPEQAPARLPEVVLAVVAAVLAHGCYVPSSSSSLLVLWVGWWCGGGTNREEKEE
jgi:hypothetical protein